MKQFSIANFTDTIKRCLYQQNFDLKNEEKNDAEEILCEEKKKFFILRILQKQNEEHISLKNKNELKDPWIEGIEKIGKMDTIHLRRNGNVRFKFKGGN